MSDSEAITQLLRQLPSVDAVCAELQHLDVSHTLLVNECRRELELQRGELRVGVRPTQSVRDAVESRIRKLLAPSLRQVINATGVILHTNLGRAPLADFEPINSYSNLEYDLETGKRGKRDVHTSSLLNALLNRPAIVVNNNAAAVFLVLNELAAGQEVIVSRGELIEIGDGFRIPEIMARSGAILREVGTTNKTNLSDYSNAMNERTRLILRVHPSNFHILGFTARPSLSELATLGVPVYEDLGSGCLVDLKPWGIDEPLVSESFRSGANLVSFSCDKLLGGPQSGIIAGDGDLLQRIRKNPLYRALRVDKLIIESLETTLRHLLLEQWSAIPTLRMICENEDRLHTRADTLASGLSSLAPTIEKSESPIGGGSTPHRMLPTWLVRVPGKQPHRHQAQLRSQPVPVIARVENNTVVLDMRTVVDSEIPELRSAVLAVWARGQR